MQNNSNKSTLKGKKQKILLWLTGVTTTLASIAVCVPVGITVNHSLTTQQDSTQKPGPGGDDTNKPGQGGDNTNKPGGNGDTDKPGGDNGNNNGGNGGNNNGNNGGNGGEQPQPEPEQPPKVVKPEITTTEVKEIGLVDPLLTENKNADITKYWNDFFKEETNKEKLLTNADEFSKEQKQNLNVSVTPVENFQPWGGTTTYDTWKTTIDSTVYYASSLPIFTIKDLNDLKTQLNKDDGLEKILTDSGYTITAQNTYSVESNSQIYLDSSNDHVQINILEASPTNKPEDNKNINLKLPVSDLVVKTKYDVTLSTTDTTIDLSTNKNAELDLNYTVGVSEENTKAPVTNLKVPVYQNNEAYSEENILTGLNFLNPAPTSRAATDLNNRLNHQEISSASNIFNVTWSDATLVGGSDNPTAISLQATPTEGHVWASDKTADPKTIQFQVAGLQRAIRDANVKTEYKDRLTKDINYRYKYNSEGIEQLWRDMNYDNVCKKLITDDNTNNRNYNPDSIKAVAWLPVTYNGSNGCNVVYEVYPTDGHAWEDGTTEAKLISMTFDGFTRWTFA